MDKFIKHPKTIKGLAEELKKLIDFYWGKEVSEEELTELLQYWSENEAEKLFIDNDLNPTIKKVIGKKRSNLIGKWLNKTKN